MRRGRTWLLTLIKKGYQQPTDRIPLIDILPGLSRRGYRSNHRRG